LFPLQAYNPDQFVDDEGAQYGAVIPRREPFGHARASRVFIDRRS